MPEINDNSILLFTLGDKFLKLSRFSIGKLIETGNNHSVLSDYPLTPEAIEKETEWCDVDISVPVLFNFYHGIELMLKGAISLRDDTFSSHKFSVLISKYSELYGENELISLIKKCTIEMPEQYNGCDNLMKTFLLENKINIDLWYQALKYPFSNRGEVFEHFCLKYGSERTIPFWEQIYKMNDEISKLSARLYHSFE